MFSNATPQLVPYSTPAEQNRLQREFKHLQLEVFQKQHYINSTRRQMCDAWKDNLRAQEARMKDLENQLQGAYAYDTRRDYQNITNTW